MTLPEASDFFNMCMPSFKRQKQPGYASQRGQALVFTTVTALIMMLAMLSMYSIGQLTNEKIRLQNTADAAAYSAAIAQARDYNFSAYTNRAMIANDVAVAQLVALRSWSENYNETFKSGGMTSKADPGQGGAYSWVVGGPLYVIWSASETVAKNAANTMQAAFKTGAEALIPTLLLINDGFGVTQKVYHYGTALTVGQILGVDDKFNEIMRSAVGFDLSLIASFIRFGNTYNVIQLNDNQAALSLLGFGSYAYNTSQWLKFTENRNPVGPWGTDHSDESWSYVRNECHGTYVYNLIGPDWCWSGGSSYGGWTDVTYWVTDIRSRNYPDDGTFDGPQKDRFANVVTASLDKFTTDRNKKWWLPILVDPIVLIGPDAKIPSAWFFKMLFHSSEGAELANDDRLTSRKGVGQGYKKNPGSWNNRWQAHDETSFLGLSTVPVCGIPFWGCINIPANPVLAPGQISKSEANASTGNSDGSINTREIFRVYQDVKDVEQGTDSAHQNWTSPAILVEVERRTGSIATAPTGALRIGRAADPASRSSGCDIGSTSRNGRTVQTVFGSGNMDLGDGSSANCMRAIAKAEAYFLRPTDLWAREDGKTEYGSLYNPYWQARMVNESLLDKTSSLAFQYCSGKGSVGSCVDGILSGFQVVLNLAANSFVSSAKSFLP